MKVLALFFAVLLLTAFPALPDSVTLNDGEVIQGEIVSETDAQVVVEMSNSSRTITSHRSILKSDIKTIQREPAQQKQERRAYEALAKLQLNPNQEQSTDYCTQGIAAFEKFLGEYPNSDKAAIIQQRVEAWHAELRHVADGQVKFGDKWMTPDEKQPLVDHWQKQLNVQAVQGTLQTLKNQLADLKRQRSTQAEGLAVAQAQLNGLQTKLASLQATPLPTYDIRIHSGKSFTLFRNAAGVWYYKDAMGQWEVVPHDFDKLGNDLGQRTVPNLDRPQVQHSIALSQQQIASGQQALDALDAKIRGVVTQIPNVESQYRIAVAKLQEPPPTPKPVIAKATAPVPVVEPTPPPPPVAAAPKPWIVRNWKGLAIGGGILVILPILAYPLLRRAERTQKERERLASAAREQLRKIFDRMFVEGERPSGMNTPEGDVVPIGKGNDASGGGRWFVISSTHIWAVQNNGRDGDNWVYNNVATDGPGAIGACVPVEPEVADAIRKLADVAS